MREQEQAARRVCRGAVDAAELRTLVRGWHGRCAAARNGRGLAVGDTRLALLAHRIKTSAGKELEVLVSKDFKLVDAREHAARP